MSKHTLGPWMIKKTNDGISIVSNSIEDDNYTESVAIINDRWLGNEKDKAANARLIASAPELLKALKKVEKYHSGTNSEVGFVIREAIAKAEGV